jgi:hypothetical protein
MNQHVNKALNPAGATDPDRPGYEPPVLIDYGSMAALTLGTGSTMGSDAWGAGGAGGGS